MAIFLFFTHPFLLKSLNPHESARIPLNDMNDMNGQDFLIHIKKDES